MSDPLVGVIDIGKTSTRLFLVDPGSGRTIWSARRSSATLRGAALNQIDIADAERWLLDTLTRAPGRERLTHLVPVAHGAAAVLLDRCGVPLLAPDYEDPRFGRTRAAYSVLRDDFSATFSPHLPDGQNLGAQLHFVQSELPALWAQVAHILPLPQYLAWRLSGVMASEVTSLGVHTDVWLPRQGQFSALARGSGWDRLFPPLRAADAVLGEPTPAVVRATGLARSCRVLCGLHDSNASLLGRTQWRPHDETLAVVSSGTWTIAMARGVDLGRLDPARDMLANVDAFGRPVGTSRFMGGREYLAIAGPDGLACAPDVQAVRSIVGRGWMALPTFSPAGGPFQGCAGRIVGPGAMGPGDRSALAAVYLALVVDVMLDLLGHAGTLVLDGPLADNPLFPGLLAALRSGSPVVRAEAGEGSVCGALALVRGLRGAAAAQPEPAIVQPIEIAGLAPYRDEWRRCCPA